MKKIISYCIILVGLIFAPASWASTINEDSLTQTHLLLLGQEHIAASKYDSARFIYLDLSEQFQEAKNWEKLVTCYNKISESYWRVIDLDPALKYAEQADSISKRYFLTESVGYAQTLRQLGVISFYEGDLTQSRYHCEKAKTLLLKNKDQNQEVITQINRVLSGIYIYTGENRLTLDLCRQELDRILLVRYPDTLDLTTAYLNLGAAYLTLFHLDSAEYFLQNASQITKESVSENNLELSDIYHNLSIMYFSKREFNKSLDYAYSALEIKKKIYTKQSLDIASSYQIISAVLEALGKTEEALKYAKMGLSIVSNNYGKDHPDVANLYTIIAIISSKLDDGDLALGYYKQALSIRKNALGNYSYFTGQSYNDIGEYYFSNSDYDSAIYYFKSALKIYNKTFGENSSQTAHVSGNIAESYLRQGQYLDQALEYYDQALEFNIQYESNDGSVELSRYFNPIYQLISMSGRASAYNRKNKLTQALLDFQRCDTIINTIRWSNLSWEDQMLLSERVSNLYREAVSVSVSLYDQANDTKYLNLAFNFNESGKASNLKKAFSAVGVGEFNLIPEEERAIEKSLEANINYYKKRIIEEKTKKELDMLKISAYEGELFSSSGKLDSFEMRLRRNYPKYYQLKRGLRNVKISEIQSRLDSKTALVEYLLSDTTLFTFLFTQKNLEVFRTSLDSTFQNQLSDLINYAKSNEGNDKSPIPDSKYAGAAHKWYTTLLAEPLSKLHEIENLKIIPDGILSYLPFELLLKTSSSAEDYSSLDYLIRHYNISYGYTSDNIVSSNQSHNAQPKSLDFLGYAPSYSNIDIELIKGFDNIALRSALINLDWNQHEVEQIGEQLDGVYFLSDQATETSFKSKAENSKIIHLAMHALLDDENPMKSKLVFSQKNDSLNDGFLNTHELFGLKLNPDLVILSACNTASGELRSGEGIISLAYGFAYAGCSSVVSSFWPVDDKSTSELMIYFYEGLEEGLTKSKALRMAKLKMIEQGGSFKSNPFYWGAFVLIGDDDPIQTDAGGLWYMIAMGLVAMTVIIFYLKKSRQNLV